MRTVFCACDYCGRGTHTVRFDGGGYCSHECASGAELAKRRQGKETRLRQDAARTRQADQLGALRVGIGLTCLFLVAVLSGCDSPADHVGPDELAHVRAGHSVVEVTQ
jgi:hypothetical protein